MENLPHYAEAPAPAPAAAAPKPTEEVAPETVRLAPVVVFGGKKIKLSESELLTKKAFSAALLKRYDYSGFSLFQHREEVRLEEMASLKTYSDNLLLAGDAKEARAIRKESSRLFLKPHDPETEAMDAAFNPRSR